MNPNQIDHYIRSLKSAPLAMYDAALDSFRSIPAALDPLVLKQSDWDELSSDANLILSALMKVIRWLQRDDQKGLSDILFANLSPLERSAAAGEFGDHLGLATARLDLFFDQNNLKVIEINATIPAMQAYSDMVQNAFESALLGSHVDLKLSNTQQLLDSLLAHYQNRGGAQSHPRIGIVARKGDSQMAELLWFQKKWTAQGYGTTIGLPEDVKIENGLITLANRSVDLIYRHIFAYRLEPNSAFTRALVDSAHAPIFNPISAHLEAKGVLAELSRIADSSAKTGEVGLSENEVKAVQSRVVWSRVLMTNLLENPDFIQWAVEHQDRLIVKSSLGYGGLSVFFGKNFGDPEVQIKLKKMLGTQSDLSWSDFLGFCMTKQEGQWIIQKRVDGKKVRSRIWNTEEIKTEEVYVDCSIFASTRTDVKTNGGVSRFSKDPIVNLGRGGGLMPLTFT